MKDKNRLILQSSLIRSRLDYGAPIYNLARKPVLTLLDPIQSSSLRLALEAVHTSPKFSLCAEAAEPIVDSSQPPISCHPFPNSPTPISMT